MTGTPERELRADCARCVALCCVAPAFAASADFAIDKGAGTPCPNLAADHRCSIHERLRERGFAGCVAYDCLGAGQRVSGELFPGRDWRTDPAVAGAMFTAFDTVRRLHEVLWYLESALALPAARPLHDRLRAAREETDALAGAAGATGAGSSPAAVDAHRVRVAPLLREASALARARFAGSALDRRGADLLGTDLRDVDLRGADLRGSVLVGADLRGADLALADLTGADLRGADVRGADLHDALFVRRSQLESARGDRATGVPANMDRPAHWG